MAIDKYGFRVKQPRKPSNLDGWGIARPDRSVDEHRLASYNRLRRHAECLARAWSEWLREDRWLYPSEDMLEAMSEILDEFSIDLEPPE